MKWAIKNGTKCAFNVKDIVSQNDKKINILNMQRITGQAPKDYAKCAFHPIFSRLHIGKKAPKGRFLQHMKILCKMFRKSLTCADFMVIICRVIRA